MKIGKEKTQRISFEKGSRPGIADAKKRNRPSGTDHSRAGRRKKRNPARHCVAGKRQRLSENHRADEPAVRPFGTAGRMYRALAFAM